MNILKKLYYNTWNIGFIEHSINEVICSNDTQFEVHWVQHKYKDRFFADPFILSADDKIIKVLVEEFPYYKKKGIISLLNINRLSYKIESKKIVLEQPYHMSFPYIQRNNDGNVMWVAPEASESGGWYRYSINPQTEMLEEQRCILKEQSLDSVIVKYGGMYWLFCTKRGKDSNKKLFIYYGEKPEGPWIAHASNPVVEDATMARAAGNIISDGHDLYRVVQKCDNTYGEFINVFRIDTLTESSFSESFIKSICAQKDMYSGGFHTINGFGELCVVDGLRTDFRPLHRVCFETRNILNFHK